MNTSNQSESSSLPRELRAVLTIVEADNELRRKALPYINFIRKEIDWVGIFQNDFGGGHIAALLFAKAIWCDCITTKSDPFDRAFSMSPQLQVATLKALAIRWGLA